MSLVESFSAGLVAAALGWCAAGLQYRLYSNAEYRAHPAQGARLLILRLFLSISSGVTVALAFRPGHYDAGPAALTAVFAFALLVTASTDWERRIIPNLVSYPAIGLAIALSWAWPDRSVAAILLGGGFALAVAAVLFALGVAVGALLGGGAALGMGDAKLMVWIGLLTGWPAVMSALVYGVLAAGVVAVVLLFRRGKRSTFSYGPYLVFGALIVMLFPGRFV